MNATPPPLSRESWPAEAVLSFSMFSNVNIFPFFPIQIFFEDTVREWVGSCWGPGRPKMYPPKLSGDKFPGVILKWAYFEASNASIFFTEVLLGNVAASK